MGNITVKEKRTNVDDALIARMNNKISSVEKVDEKDFIKGDLAAGDSGSKNNIITCDAETSVPVRTECDYEMVNHPSHYNHYDVEVVDMMERIWGREATATWCKMTAFKYRMRMGTKPGSSLKQDLDKETWYLNKAKELSK